MLLTQYVVALRKSNLEGVKDKGAGDGRTRCKLLMGEQCFQRFTWGGDDGVNVRMIISAFNVYLHAHDAS
jgi:hypothetical protein